MKAEDLMNDKYELQIIPKYYSLPEPNILLQPAVIAITFPIPQASQKQIR